MNHKNFCWKTLFSLFIILRKRLPRLINRCQISIPSERRTDKWHLKYSVIKKIRNKFCHHNTRVKRRKLYLFSVILLKRFLSPHNFSIGCSKCGGHLSCQEHWITYCNLYAWKELTPVGFLLTFQRKKGKWHKIESVSEHLGIPLYPCATIWILSKLACVVRELKGHDKSHR